MAYRNTYDFQAMTTEEYLSATANVTHCLDLVEECRSIADVYDPENMGIDATVNAVCGKAYRWCYLNIEAAYLTSGVRYPS